MTPGPPATPGQTVGPFFHAGLPAGGGARPVDDGRPSLHGRVLDGAGDAVQDALVEVWGRSTGWGRCPTDEAGRYAFATSAPAADPGLGLPFVAVCVLARGLLDRLLTRAYLLPAGVDPTGDPFLAALPPGRRGTLLATPDADGHSFDIRLQGEEETVFLRHGGR